jgi:HrpA-like RNA helicase
MEKLTQKLVQNTSPENHSEEISSIKTSTSKEAIRAITENQVPMDLYREEVVDCIQNNTNSIIIGETGSGKTTRVPIFLMETFPYAKIAVTQPRRVAVRSVANYVAQQKKERIGGKIGYQIRFEDLTSTGTRLNFLSDGILLRKISGDPILKEYDIVMIDEAHERSLNMDFALALLKRANKLRKEAGIKELKIIVASATIEKEKFINYFDTPGCMEVPGRMFPVETIYHDDLSTAEDDFISTYEIEDRRNERTKEIIQDICEKKESGDILIFEPGVNEIMNCMTAIQSLNLTNVKIYPLHAKMDSNRQDDIFKKTPHRKIIIATNIAETSITLDGVRFVIDKGQIRQSQFDTTTGMTLLEVTPHSKSGLNQRKGRAGRTAPGTCHRLFSKDDFNSRIDHTIPEISRSNLGTVILTLKKLGINDLENFDFIEKIPTNKIRDTIKELQKIQALDENENITQIGIEMEKLPLQPNLSRMVIEGKKRNCLEETCAIAAMLPFAQNIFTQSNLTSERNSDFLLLLEAFIELFNTDYKSEAPIVRNIPPQKRNEIKEVFNQLMKICNKKSEKKGKTFFSGEKSNILKCVLLGNANNILVFSRIKKFKKKIQIYYKKSRETNTIEAEYKKDKTSVKDRTDILIANSLFNSGNGTFMNTLQKVDPKEIIETLPHLVYKHSEPQKAHFCKEQGRVAIPISYYLKDFDKLLLQKDDFETFIPTIFASIYANILTNKIKEVPKHTEILTRNKELFSKIVNLIKRSGKDVPIKELNSFYIEKIMGIELFDDVLELIKDLEVKISDFCDPTIIEQLEREFPETININGYTAILKYSASDTTDEYQRNRNECTVKINPEQDIFSIQDSDIDQSKLPSIPVIYSYIYSKATSIEELKDKITQNAKTDTWDNFKKKTNKYFNFKWQEPIPSLESIGFKPRTILIEKSGQTINAYPAWEILLKNHYEESESNYTKEEDIQNITFRATYCQTKEEAEQKTIEAHKYYNYYIDLIKTYVEGTDHLIRYKQLMEEIPEIRSQIRNISEKLKDCPYYNILLYKTKAIREDINNWTLYNQIQKQAKDANIQLEEIKEKYLNYLAIAQALQNERGDINKIIEIFTEKAFSKKYADPTDSLYLIEIINGQVCTLKKGPKMTPIEYSDSKHIKLKSQHNPAPYIENNILHGQHGRTILKDGYYLLNLDRNKSYQVVPEEYAPFGIKEITHLNLLETTTRPSTKKEQDTTPSQQEDFGSETVVHRRRHSPVQQDTTPSQQEDFGPETVVHRRRHSPVQQDTTPSQQEDFGPETVVHRRRHSPVQQDTTPSQQEDFGPETVVHRRRHSPVQQDTTPSQQEDFGPETVVHRRRHSPVQQDTTPSQQEDFGPETVVHRRRHSPVQQNTTPSQQEDFGPETVVHRRRHSPVQQNTTPSQQEDFGPETVVHRRRHSPVQQDTTPKSQKGKSSNIEALLKKFH